MKIHVIHHPDEALVRIFSVMISNERKIMATIEELTQAVADVKAIVDQFGPAVNAFEARITQLLVGQIPPNVQAAVDRAVEDLKAVAGSGSAALADAADGIDEAAQPPSPPPADTTPPPADQPA